MMMLKRVMVAVLALSLVAAACGVPMTLIPAIRSTIPWQPDAS
jgi:ABC-type glycerol-3-phosphate transport system substrate-binding protein